MDALVTIDTGGDFWMSPQKQAAVLREHPWTGAARPGQMMAHADVAKRQPELDCHRGHFAGRRGQDLLGL